MAYVTFVYENYFHLPDYMVFAHGHERAWHQPEPLSYLLRALKLPVLDALGWVSLRCALQNTCESPEKYVRPHQMPEWELNTLLAHIHSLVMRPNDSWYQPLPDEFAAPCCGQFAVTRKQIRSRPHEYWRRLHMAFTQDFSEDLLNGTVGDRNAPMSWKLGGVFEFTSHWWFGMRSVVCLDTEYCRNTVFQGKIHCDGETWDLATAQFGWENITCTFSDQL